LIFINKNLKFLSVILTYPLNLSNNSTTLSKSGNLTIDINVKPIEIEEPVEIEESIEIERPFPEQEDSYFDFSFLKMENNKRNMLYSPLSIKYGLKVLQEGAAGNTYNEINNIIGNSTLIKYTKNDKNISLANGLFIRDSFYDDISTKYINTLKEKYDAEIKKDEFKDAKNANQWIEDKTSGIIKNMLNDDTVICSEVILINALTIDLEWNKPFYYEETRGKPFYMDNGQEMIATTMKKIFCDDYIYFYVNKNITAITMDFKIYNGIQMEFMAIMPCKNLSNFVKTVSKAQIQEIDRNLKKTAFDFELEIPKFKFNYDLKLKEDLVNLGINDAFDSLRADFSKMVDGNPSGLCVSEALHKADIDFNENGVKAAAANEFSMPRCLFGSIKINKPFMFIIRDKNTKDIWFTGTVYEPNLWENEKESYEEEMRDFRQQFLNKLILEDKKEDIKKQTINFKLKNLLTKKKIEKI